MQKENIVVITPRAFTLIELLVVVLIIGLLAAVAVPQYNSLITKDRIKTWISRFKAVKKAEEVYYLQNGTYTQNLENLAVSLPCNRVVEGVYSCSEDIALHLSNNKRDGYIILLYCPKHSHEWPGCVKHATVEVGQLFDHSEVAPRKHCKGNKKLCDLW